MKRKIFIVLFYILCMVNSFIVAFVASNLNLLYEGFLILNLDVTFALRYRNLLYLVAALIITSDVMFSFLVPLSTSETK